MPGPLAGLKVVEMKGLGPCPLAGQLLADLGAEVILVDRKSGKADPADINNRGKRSIALDLKAEQGREIALKLIERADILIEGFRPGVMEKLGLGPEECHAINPGLIFGRMTGWGQTGPLSNTAGHDINYAAISGALAMVGRKGEPPVPPLNLFADYAGGTMFLLLGVLAALHERHHSGRGQVVDAAMTDGLPALMGLIHSLCHKGQWQLERESNLLDGGAPFYRCYETADGKYLSVGPLEPQFFSELVERAGIDQAHLADQYDAAKWSDRHAAYEALFRSKTREEWMALFEGSDACVAPVLTLDEVQYHPHNAERGIFVEIDGVLQAAPAPRFNRTPVDDVCQPPAPGADGRFILGQLGYTDEQVEALAEARVLT